MVRKRWHELMMQYIRTTTVSQVSSGFLSILPVLAVYLVFHKQISTGMTAGALK